MACRGLVVLLLVLTSCNADACRGRAKKSEPTVEPEPPVTATPVTFDDVPRKIREKTQLTLPPIFPGIAKLPASVRSVERYSRTESTQTLPPILRAGEMATEFCATEMLAGRWWWQPHFYNAEWRADALLDERLAPRLECGAKAAIASGFQWYIVKFDEASRAGNVGFLPRDARIVPRFYETPAVTPAGLEQLSCDLIDGDGCAAYAHAVAIIPRLDMLAVGSFSALALLAPEPAEKWEGADPARVPTLTPEEMVSADVRVTTFDDGDFGVLGVAFVRNDDEDRDKRREIQQALRRAEAVGIIAAPAFSEGDGVLAISTRGNTDGVVKALGLLQQAAKREPLPAPGEVESLERAAVDARERRALAESVIETTGNEVRLRFKWAFNANDIELRRQAEAARTTRLTPLVAVLTARAAAAEPSEADLEGLGAGFAKTYSERAARKKKVVPTMLHDSLPGLKLPSFQRQGMNTDKDPMVSYAPTVESVDDLLDTLRGDGWLLRLNSVQALGPLFSATKRGNRLFFRVSKSDQELRVSIKDW